MNSTAISLLNTKICLNSVISDVNKGATFSTVDIKTPTFKVQWKRYQYTQTSLKYFTPEICTEYDIRNLTRNGYVNIEIRRGIYMLKEASILAFNYIIKLLHLLNTIWLNTPQVFGSMIQGLQLSH